MQNDSRSCSLRAGVRMRPVYILQEWDRWQIGQNVVSHLARFEDSSERGRASGSCSHGKIEVDELAVVISTV